MNGKSLQVVLCVALLLLPASIPARAQDTAPRLQIEVIEGQGGINSIGQRSNREPVIQVEDENRKAIAGASVVFFLPSMGPGGTFDNGSTTLTTTTNGQGQAVARGIRFNNQPGEMQIRVTASYAGQTANTIITQTNVTAGSGKTGGMSLGTKLLILGVIAGAGIAAGVALGHGGSSSSPTAPPGAVITPGTPTVGAPQ